MYSKQQSGGSGGKSASVDMLSLGTFVKYACEILLGFVPRKLLSLAQVAGVPVSDVPVKLLIPTPLSDEMRTIVTETYSVLCDDLIIAHKEYRSMERRFEKDKLLHGSITEQKQLELDTIKRYYEKLQSTVVGLAECADFDIPELKEEKEQQEDVKGISVWEGSSTAGTSATGPIDFGPYGDAESKAFYDDLPDLLTLIPLTALGLTPEQTAVLRETWKSGADTDNGSVEGVAKDKESGELTADNDDTDDTTGTNTEATDTMPAEVDGDDEATGNNNDKDKDEDEDEKDDEDDDEGRDKFDDTPHVSLKYHQIL